jgi:hypothetical protein
LWLATPFGTTKNIATTATAILDATNSGPPGTPFAVFYTGTPITASIPNGTYHYIDTTEISGTGTVSGSPPAQPFGYATLVVDSLRTGRSPSLPTSPCGNRNPILAYCDGTTSFSP